MAYQKSSLCSKMLNKRMPILSVTPIFFLSSTEIYSASHFINSGGGATRIHVKKQHLSKAHPSIPTLSQWELNSLKYLVCTKYNKQVPGT